MIDKNVKIYPNVKLGKNVRIEGPAIIGEPPRGKKPGELETIIGDNAVIRQFTVIYAGTKIGNDFQTGVNAFIREDNIIGDNVSVGTNAVLEYGNKIGNNVRIHSGSFLEKVTIGNNVFIAPNVVFTDDPHPPCPRYSECAGGAVVEDNVKIGANSTILPGISIGRGALIGAGSVVTKNVEAKTVYAGNPAKKIKAVKDLKCDKGYYDYPYQWEEE